ncbi:PilZ domain-containing protein [Thiomicrospira sp. WB1]|jgi:hypothetical protein|uniref:PilZ domain-containing protein n=1 Tax=Thiomicrospira sp. WB1 TaxID=1685380 RepID=UPI000747FFF8|nr:PilZ domain-containing protein [Thiomicrospira sp. WB1]KUJ72600.1 hypothetical protein AVO41_02005 [Thiomicrospira sp. WB1]
MSLFHAPSTQTDRKVIVKGQTVEVEGRLLEISTKGLAIESPKNAAIGIRLETRFELPALGEFNQMNLHGIVREHHATEKGFMLSLELEEQDAQTLAIIQDFLDYKQRLHDLSEQYGYKASNPT